MIAETDSHYEIVANALQEAVPGSWQKIWVRSKISNDMAEHEFNYLRTDGAEQWLDPDPQIVARIGRAIRDLRSSMIEKGQDAWTSSVFTLLPDGTFKFDVEYEH